MTPFRPPPPPPPPPPVPPPPNSMGAGIDRPARALVYMLVAAFGYSWAPLLIAWGNGSDNPFFFNAGWRLGVVAGCLCVLLVGYRKLLTNKEAMRFVAGRVVSWWIALTVLCANFDYALLAWSATFIDISMSAIIFEVYPIFVMFIMSAVMNRRYLRPTAFQSAFMVAGFIGFYFVAISQTGEWKVWQTSGDVSFIDLLSGIGLAVLGALAVGCLAFSVRWGSDLAAKLASVAKWGNDHLYLHLFGMLTAFTIANLISVPVNVTIGLFAGDTLEWQSLGFAFLGGVLVHTFATVFYRLGIATTANLAVNVVMYITPVFTLTWLLSLADVEIMALHYLIIGALWIAMSNVVVNFDAEIGWGYKSMIMAMGIAGIVVYLRDDIFGALHVAGWRWTGGGYFEAIALSATVFTLLLAFRVGRLITRTNAEERQTFSVFRKLHLLVQRGVISRDVLDCILRIDASANSSNLQEAYTEMRNIIAGVCPINDADRQMLNEAEAELDALVRSKQRVLALGELFALVVFAGITVALALFSIPTAVNTWTRVLVDVFAMLISAVVTFLTVNVWDLQRERQERKLEFRPTYCDYVVIFSDKGAGRTDIILSVLIGVVIIVTYAALLAAKWVF